MSKIVTMYNFELSGGIRGVFGGYSGGIRGVFGGYSERRIINRIRSEKCALILKCVKKH